MSDETKAGIVSIIWISAFAVFVADPSPIRALLLIFTTVVELLYCKHDVEQEELRKSRNRYAAHTSEEIRKSMAAAEDELPEDRVKRIIGGFR